MGRPGGLGWCRANIDGGMNTLGFADSLFNAQLEILAPRRPIHILLLGFDHRIKIVRWRQIFGLRQ